MMHDIGMLSLPDSVLLCPDELNEEQTRAMQSHPLLAVQMMQGMEFLDQEIPAVRSHHEHFDGTGYPDGLAGAAIPLTARILAVGDSFDAITSPRTFRGAKTQAEAMEEIRQGAGTQFDPAVVQLKRIYVAGATRCAVDKHGRLLIPALLREYAGIGRDLVWAGMVSFVEIWAKEAWTEQSASSRVNREAIVRALTELGL